MSRPLRIELDAAELVRAVAADPAALRELVAALRPHLDESADELLTSAEAASYLRTTPARVRRLVHEKRIAAEHDGARLLLRRRELDRYLAGGDR